MIAAPIIITADEINCLIYSYFQDSGMYLIPSFLGQYTYRLHIQGSTIPPLHFATKVAYRTHLTLRNTFQGVNSSICLAKRCSIWRWNLTGEQMVLQTTAKPAFLFLNRMYVRWQKPRKRLLWGRIFLWTLVNLVSCR